jgi:putative hydrolase of the HAD superfamily
MIRRQKALLLDFGGVIAKSFFETRTEFEALLGLPSDTFDWRGPFDPDSDALWRSVLAGEITEGAYWATRAEECGAAIGERWTLREFCRRHNGLPIDVTFRLEAKRLIVDARREGIKLAILTNELESLNGAEWIENSPIVRLFDALVDATRTGIPKPDPRAYRLALTALGVRAEETIFVDDQSRNVDGCAAVGIRGVHLDITRPGLAFGAAREMLGVM